MSLQFMFGTLTQRFRTTTTTMNTSKIWIRNMSIFNNSTSNKNTHPSLPSILTNPLQEPKEITTSLEPYAGRFISNVSNVNAAYRRLNTILIQNNVRREIRSNLRYEKPNVERRRKNIERNRKLFGAMIRKKVALIMQMKQRGM
ncbi:unnamed protein product [Cunninghamella blakesleeana]